MAVTEKVRELDVAGKIPRLRQAVLKMPGTPPLLFELALALAEAGEHSESAKIFREGFLVKPVPSPWPPTVADPRARVALRELARSLIAHGAIFSPVIAALAAAEARLGNETEVRRLVDYGRFFRTRRVETPEEFRESDFNSLLATEIKSDLKYYGRPKHRAFSKGWRGIVTSRLPASRALCRALRDEVDRYLAELPGDSDHPFIASRPAEYVLEGWGVVSDGASHHSSHIHPRAWLSGVYYVVRPPSSTKAGTDCGWLRVGPPDRQDTYTGWDTRLVEPEPGNLVLMPAYFYHSTQPLGVDEERICVAFDVVPLEIAAASPITDY